MSLARGLQHATTIHVSGRLRLQVVCEALDAIIEVGHPMEGVATPARAELRKGAVLTDGNGKELTSAPKEPLAPVEVHAAPAEAPAGRAEVTAAPAETRSEAPADPGQGPEALADTVAAAESFPDRQPDCPESVQSSPAITATLEEEVPAFDVPEPPGEAYLTPVSAKSGHQGVVPTTEMIRRDLNETFEDIEIPELDDLTAPRDCPGEHSLTANAIRCRTKRIFTRKADGSAKVAESIFAEWHAGGEGKKTLESIFKQCGYNPAASSKPKHKDGTLPLRKRLSQRSL